MNPHVNSLLKNLLVELLVEELPPKALKSLGEAFATGLQDSLRAQGLIGANAVTTSFASPRRLAVHITEVRSTAPDSEVVWKLMRKAVAVLLRSMAKSTTLLPGLQNALEETIRKLPIPKVMSYQLADGWSTVNFVRPAHGLVAIHGDETIAVSVLGLKAGHTTQGHRFEASKPSIELQDADSYAQQLADEGAVIASFAARRAEIARQLRES